MRRPLCVVCLFYTLVIMGLTFLFPIGKTDESLSSIDGVSQTIEGTIYKIDIQNEKSVVYITTEEVSTETAANETITASAVATSIGTSAHLPTKTTTTKVICYLSDPDAAYDVKIGNTVTMTGKASLFDEPTNDGQFDSATYYHTLGLDYAMFSCSMTVVDESFDPYRQLLHIIRVKGCAILAAYLDEDEASIMQAMLFGQKGNMSEEIKNLFQKNGVSHVLAISGLHISLLGMGLYKLLKKLRCPEIPCGIISMLLVISYGKMVGEGASVIRSAVMFSLFLTAELLKRTYDIFIALSLSAAVLVTLQPLYAYQGGFWLSFGAVMGLAIVKPWVDAHLFPGKDLTKAMTIVEGLRQKKWEAFVAAVKESISGSLSVCIATLPIQLYFYFATSFYGILLNLIIVPAVGVLLYCGVAAVSVGALAEGLGGGAIQAAAEAASAEVVMEATAGSGTFAGFLFTCLTRLCFIPIHFILTFILWLLRLFRRLPFGYLVLGRPALWKMVVYYLILAALLLYDAKQKKTTKENEMRFERFKEPTIRLATWGMMACLVLFLGLRIRSHTSLYMLDIGQGDCFVIEAKGGKNILIDGGSSSISNIGKYRIIPFLECHGITHVDYVFISHGDSDHTSGILELLEAEDPEITIRNLVLSVYAMQDDTADSYSDLVTDALAAGTQILYISTGDSFSFPDMTLSVLFPDGTEGADGNDESQVLLMECGGVRTLFTGDLTEVMEPLIDTEGVDILKVGHHGSKYSSTADFLAMLRPTIGLISAGKDNSYGHPTADTLSRLAAVGTDSLCTIDTGQVTVRFHQGSYTVATFLPLEE